MDRQTVNSQWGFLSRTATVAAMEELNHVSGWCCTLQSLVEKSGFSSRRINVWCEGWIGGIRIAVAKTLITAGPHMIRTEVLSY